MRDEGRGARGEGRGARGEGRGARGEGREARGGASNASQIKSDIWRSTTSRWDLMLLGTPRVSPGRTSSGHVLLFFSFSRLTFFRTLIMPQMDFGWFYFSEEMTYLYAEGGGREGGEGRWKEKREER